MDALDAGHRVRYLALNTSTAPLWLAMIVAPRAAGTARVLRVALLLTWLAGPAGLLLFLAQRRLRPAG